MDIIQLLDYAVLQLLLQLIMSFSWVCQFFIAFVCDFAGKLCWKNSWSEGVQLEENTGGDWHQNISSGTRLHERF